MKCSVKEAKQIIANLVHPVGTEIVTLERAFNRIIAQDIVAPSDMPANPTSAMDGYAFRTEDVGDLPCRLRIAGEILAKDEPPELTPGETFYVATGAQIPRGADTVIRIEDAKVEGQHLIVDTLPKKGEFINPKGSEVKKGDKVITKGTQLNYRLVGLLAHLGVYQIRVYKRPSVGIIVTGDEIAEPFEKGTIKNSNLYIMMGLLQKEGAEVHYVDRVKDAPNSIKGSIAEAVKHHDIVLTTGGVSVGKADYVRNALKDLQADIHITETTVKPGRPLVFATLENTLFFGLPGYPSAMLVNALEFLVPALRKMQGKANWDNTYHRAVAAEDFKSRKGKAYYIRVNLENINGTLYAKSTGSQLTSNYLTSAICDAFLIVPEEKERIVKGETARILIP